MYELLDIMLSITATAITLMIVAVFLVGRWKIFIKAGKPGWAAIIPFYNIYIMSIVVFGNLSYFIVYLVASFLFPLIYPILRIACSIKLSKAFGKSGGFTAGMIFLPFIFEPILGFGKSEYIGPQKIFN